MSSGGFFDRLVLCLTMSYRHVEILVQEKSPGLGSRMLVRGGLKWKSEDLLSKVKGKSFHKSRISERSPKAATPERPDCPHRAKN